MNVIVYCIEDDRDLKSAFWMDLANLRDPPASCAVHVRYRPHGHHFSSCDVSVGSSTRGLQVVKPLPNLRFVKGAIRKDLTQFLQDNYATGKENIMVLQSHGYDGDVGLVPPLIYISGGASMPKSGGGKEESIRLAELRDFALASGMQFKCVILDMCCNSSVAALDGLLGCADYVLACQYTCPDYGFVSKDFLSALCATQRRAPLSWEQRLQNVARAFIRRNNERGEATDAVLVDMRCWSEASALMKNSAFAIGGLQRRAKARVVVYKEYFLYDLVTVLQNLNETTLANAVKKAICFYRQTARLNKRILHGVSYSSVPTPVHDL